MAALLHDTVEDTHITFDDLENHFGYRVEYLVQELTDDKNLSKLERKKAQIQNASKKSSEAALIVLADKLSNLSDILASPPVNWDAKRISDYFLWAKAVIQQLPQVNPLLMNAVEEVMNAYWQRLAEEEYGL